MAGSWKKRLQWAAGILMVLFLLAVGGLMFLVRSEYPGGMRPSYNAKDHDPRLEKDAATAQPVIEALEKYHLKNAAYPKTGAEIVPYLAPPPFLDAGGPGGLYGWYYFPYPEGKGYSLSLKLGWDPNLIYKFDGAQGKWVFDPGDGTPQKEIALGQ